jgi:hypothetical protein
MKATIVQIAKQRARRLYEQGKTIYLQSCNMRFNTMWQSACPINISDKWSDADSFDGIVNDYVYYNCDHERGKYPNYFVKKEDLG